MPPACRASQQATLPAVTWLPPQWSVAWLLRPADWTTRAAGLRPAVPERKPTPPSAEEFVRLEAKPPPPLVPPVPRQGQIAVPRQGSLTSPPMPVAVRKVCLAWGMQLVALSRRRWTGEQPEPVARPVATSV